MKFNPTWPQVALLVALLAAVILAHIFAPLAVSVITSMVSTVIGALFVNLSPSSDNASARPALSAVPSPKEDQTEDKA